MILDLTNKFSLYESLFNKIPLEILPQNHQDKMEKGYFLINKNLIVFIKQSHVYHGNQNLSALLNIHFSVDPIKEYEVSALKKQDIGELQLDQILLFQKYNGQQTLICKFISPSEPQILLVQDMIFINTKIDSVNNMQRLIALDFFKKQEFEYNYKAENSVMIKDSQIKSIAYLIYQRQGKIHIRAYTSKLKLCFQFSFHSQTKYISYFFNQNYEKIVFSLGQTFILLAKERSNDQQLILFAYFKTKQKTHSQRIEIKIRQIQQIEIFQYNPHLIADEQEIIILQCQQQKLLVFLVENQPDYQYEKLQDQFSVNSLDKFDFEELIKLNHKEFFMHDFIVQLPIWKNEPLIQKFMIDHFVSVQSKYNIKFSNLLVYSMSYGLKKDPIFVISILRYLEIMIQILQLDKCLKDYIEAIWKYLPIVQNNPNRTYFINQPQYRNHAQWISVYVDGEHSDSEMVWALIYKIQQKNELFYLM